jgi:threonine aldolase
VRLHDQNYRGFASDNYAGAHPEVLAALAEANGGHQISYGADSYTERLTEVHLDRARIANAAAALGVPLRDFTVDAGVDILSFGGTKNGAL